jgi:hypothetical protein
MDRNNQLYGVSGASTAATAPVLFSGTAQTPSASFSGSSLASNVNPGSLYSITQIGNYNFGAGASMTLTGGVSETVNPVPSALVLVLSGSPVLAAGCWFCGRKRPT